MTATFITHARTLDELRAEIVSDLQRRLASLDMESRHERRVGKLAAIGRAKMELESALSYWSSVELRGARKQTPTATQLKYDLAKIKEKAAE